MPYEEFIKELERRLGGSEYKIKRWPNYPNSIFFYRKDVEDYSTEIGIYTNEKAYGIYI